MGEKECAFAALDPEYESYVVYVASLSSNSLVASLGSTPLNVHPFQRPQISVLIAKEAPTKVFNEHTNFADVFFLDLVTKLSKHTKINDHAIQLVNGQQPSYRLI